MSGVQELTPALGAGAACRALGLWRGAPARQHEKLRRAAFVGPRRRRAARVRSPLALDTHERHVLLETLNSERFVDTAPAAVHATLLDEGRYLGSVRTMYRLLAIHGGCRERRNQLTHPAYTKPELLALAPNQVWSWDITKLKGPAKWTCFHLYVILDIFSRYVVGWLLAERESAELAEQLIAETVARHDVEPGMLTLHADRGSSMRSKPVAALLVDLDVAKSHSRPHVSDDNPFSESQFKTMKYRPDFPARFGSIEDARAHCQVFFPWYNDQHRHSGIGYMTPHSVHYGHAEAMRVSRQATLDAAFLAHPKRFKNKRPQPSAMPCAAWINPPLPVPCGPQLAQDCVGGRGGTRLRGASGATPQPASSTPIGASNVLPAQGDNHHPTSTALHSKFMTPGVAKSLTHSGANPQFIDAVNRRPADLVDLGKGGQALGDRLADGHFVSMRGSAR
jgi:putative transposase